MQMDNVLSANFPRLHKTVKTLHPPPCIRIFFEEVRAARRTTDKKAYCRMPHHRQVGLLPHAAPQTSGPIAACRTTDKWRFRRTTGKRVYLPFSLPHCKQVGLTQLTANQTENTGGGGSPNLEVIGRLARKIFRKP